MAEILVIEDDARIANLIRAYLEREGHHALVARDGREGLRHWAAAAGTSRPTSTGSG